MSQTVVSRLVSRFLNLGIKRMFGVPGGGSSLDLIEAAGSAGIDFILCRTETGAALMAAVSGELTGVPGVVLTGIGPSAASVVNGVAYASLERAPLIVITDTDERDTKLSPHQIFDQQAMFAPITKVSMRLDGSNAGEELDVALQSTLTDPLGPVHIDLSVKNARAQITDASEHSNITLGAIQNDAGHSPGELIRLLTSCHRPVLIVGLQTRRAEVAEKLRLLIERLGCPVLTSYKAKGVIAEDDPLFVGTFTGASAEGDILSKADLILMIGLDPIEMIPSPWTYEAPVAVVMQAVSDAFPFMPEASLGGELASNIDVLMPEVKASSWNTAQISDLRERMRARLAMKGMGHTADSLIDALARISPKGTRLAVDAGAHMFSAMARWPSLYPHGVLKSNGLSTMGFALPAAIASYLCEPERPVIAFTGDGGMLMCVAELSTAARLKIPLIIIVVNDAALSLIDIKQQHMQHPVNGVRYPAIDFATAARGLGCEAWQVGANETIEDVLKLALSTAGPSLIDVTANPEGYLDQLMALRK